MFLPEPGGELLQREATASQDDLIITCHGAHVGQTQFSIQETTESRLGIPIVEGDRRLQVRMLVYSLM